jgi:acyl-CoA thioester hydrolase
MPQPHRHPLRVTYADCTVGNHVYYSRYLDWLEAARGELFRAAGCTFRELQERDLIFPAVECTLKHRAPARYDELLDLAVWLTELRGARLNFAYRISRPDGAPVLEAATLHVCTSLAEKPKRIPVEVIERLESFVFHPDTVPPIMPTSGARSGIDAR